MAIRKIPAVLEILRPFFKDCEVGCTAILNPGLDSLASRLSLKPEWGGVSGKNWFGLEYDEDRKCLVVRYCAGESESHILELRGKDIQWSIKMSAKITAAWLFLKQIIPDLNINLFIFDAEVPMCSANIAEILRKRYEIALLPEPIK